MTTLPIKSEDGSTTDPTASPPAPPPRLGGAEPVPVPAPAPDASGERLFEVRLARRLRRADAAWRATLFGFPPFAEALLRRTAPGSDRRTRKSAARTTDASQRVRLERALRARERARAAASHARLERELARCVEALAPSDDVVREIACEVAETLARDADPPPAVARRLEHLERLRREVLAARNLFVERNLGLVRPMARKFAGRGLALVDLIQEANLGLLRAAEKFDPERGVRFSTYAVWWVRHALHRAFQKQARVVRLPLHGHETLVKSRRHDREAALRGDAGGTVEERAHRLGVAPGWLAEIERSDQDAESLDAPAFQDGTRELHDVVGAPAPDVGAILDLARLGAAVAEILDELSERERTVLVHRFGLNGHEPETLDALGRRLELSAERVRQLEAQALMRLRRRVRGRGFFARPEASDAAGPS